jgi:hypothetical protein
MRTNNYRSGSFSFTMKNESLLFIKEYHNITATTLLYPTKVNHHSRCESYNIQQGVWVK